VLLIVILLGVSGVVFVPDLMDSQRLLDAVEKKELKLDGEVESLEKEVADKEAYLDRIKRDPEFHRREAGQYLGEAAPGELILRVK
jgi:ribosomal protein S18 acetylase RimI-like enzyme